MNKYFKEAQIGLTGERVMDYYSKKVGQNALTDQVKNTNLVNTLSGLTEQLREEAVSQHAPSSPSPNSLHQEVIKKL